MNLILNPQRTRLARADTFSPTPVTFHFGGSCWGPLWLLKECYRSISLGVCMIISWCLLVCHSITIVCTYCLWGWVHAFMFMCLGLRMMLASVLTCVSTSESFFKHMCSFKNLTACIPFQCTCIEYILVKTMRFHVITMWRRTHAFAKELVHVTVTRTLYKPIHLHDLL